MKQYPPIDYLKSILNYDEETGAFSWKIAKGKRIKKDSPAGFIAHGYVSIKIDSKMYLAHRIAWIFKHGEIKDGDIDHINHDRSDNRILNLRHVSRSQNLRNQPIRKSNKTGVLGVSFCKKTNKYRASIMNLGKQVSLGYFNDIESASKARNLASIKYGYHSNHGANTNPSL